MRTLHSALRSISRLRVVSKDESGAVMVEFAFIAPIFLLLLFGTVIWTWALINYATLALAAGTGAQVITTERLNSSSTSWTPYTDTVNAVTAASSFLNQTIVKGNITVTINSTSCASDASCQTLLGDVTTSGSTVTPASVSVSYPCDPLTLSNPFTILFVSIGTCTFVATITGVVQ